MGQGKSRCRSPRSNERSERCTGCVALSTVNKAKMVSALLVFGLCCGFSTPGRAEKGEALAARLGYEGCRLSKPLTMAQVMAKDMSGGNAASRSHPDWDALIDKYAPGDQIYFIDCRKADPARIFAGTSLYALVRDGVVIARAMHD
jgi:hypothetical protein